MPMPTMPTAVLICLQFRFSNNSKIIKVSAMAWNTSHCLHQFYTRFHTTGNNGLPDSLTHPILITVCSAVSPQVSQGESLHCKVTHLTQLSAQWGLNQKSSNSKHNVLTHFLQFCKQINLYHFQYKPS